MSRGVRVQPRGAVRPGIRLGIPLAALVAALVAGGLVLLAAGNDPIEAYRTMFDSSMNGVNAWTRTLTLATPLTLTGLAAAIAFRMRVYNIGAEGQLYMGAIATSGLALWLPADTPPMVMLPAIILAGAIAGAVWAAFAAVPRALLGADEIITTLMLNFVALSFMNYLIFGSMSFWRDPERPVPQGLALPESAELPILSGRLHWGIFVAAGAAIGLWLLMQRTTWGFDLRTIGDSEAAARYAGMPVAARIIVVLGISGALAGLAGAVEVSGVTGRLDPKSLAVDIGFTGIVVAAVARTNPLGVVPVAVFLAAITTSGSSLQTVGVQSEIVLLLQGLIFLSVTASEFFVTNRVETPRIRLRSAPPEPEGAGA